MDLFSNGRKGPKDEKRDSYQSDIVDKKQQTRLWSQEFRIQVRCDTKSWHLRNNFDYHKNYQLTRHFERPPFLQTAIFANEIIDNDLQFETKTGHASFSVDDTSTPEVVDRRDWKLA